jgi:hypothetical protein
MSSKEWLSLVVIRRDDRVRFDARRAYVDPDDHKELVKHLREIARGVDDLPEYRDDWLSRYEMEVCPDRSESALFILSARGEDER